MTSPTMTYEEYCAAMCAYAKEVQGENYPGDDYYTQDCWRLRWECGDSPEDTVISDMSYWD